MTISNSCRSKVLFGAINALLIVIGLFVPHLSAMNSAYVIPFHLEDSFIFVNVESTNVNQKENIKLLFDLGDSRPISLTQKSLNALSHKLLGEFDEFYDYQGKLFKAQKFLLPTIKIAGREFSNVLGSQDIQDPDNLSPSSWGAIGAGFFYDVSLSIDFQLNQLVINNTQLNNCTRFSVDDGAIMSNVKVNGQSMLFIIDTGTQKTSIDKRVVKPALIQQSSADKLSVSTFKTDDFVLNDYQLNVIEMNIPGVDGIIGQDILLKHQLTIDFKNSCFQFAQVKPPNL